MPNSPTTEFLLGIVGIGMRAMEQPDMHTDELALKAFEGAVDELLARGVGREVWSAINDVR